MFCHNLPHIYKKQFTELMDCIIFLNTHLCLHVHIYDSYVEVNITFMKFLYIYIYIYISVCINMHNYLKLK